MDPYVALVCFPVIFIGELPDKTMFASLLLATHGRPRQVWLGAAAAFTVHVALAVTVGVALFSILPKRAVDAVVAALFLLGAGYSWWEASKGDDHASVRAAPTRSVILSAFVVVFIAEWGDLTQILTANLAAKYHSPLSVGVGSLLALWAVAAVAVVSGQALLRFVKISTVRKVTAAFLVALAAYSIWSAVR